MPHPNSKLSVQERFWLKVNVRGKSDCWEWFGAVITSGYGQININNKNKVTHRLSWEINVGPIPINMCVLHKCDNRVCVNPEHLFIGTRFDNMRDMVNKGRNVYIPFGRGEKNISSKLTTIQVNELRVIYDSGLMSQYALADLYSIAQGTLSEIINYKTWKD